MRIRRENKDDQKDSIKELFEDYVSNRRGKWLLQREIPTLKKCRGKIFPLSDGWGTENVIGWNDQKKQDEFELKDDWRRRIFGDITERIKDKIEDAIDAAKSLGRHIANSVDNLAEGWNRDFKTFAINLALTGKSWVVQTTLTQFLNILDDLHAVGASLGVFNGKDAEKKKLVHILKFHNEQIVNNLTTSHLHLNFWSYFEYSRVGVDVVKLPQSNRDTAKKMRRFDIIPQLLGPTVGVCIFDYPTKSQLEEVFCRSGGNLEIMGLLLGKVDANVMVVMDSFALPVEGIETQVNVMQQGYEYMIAYTASAKQVGRLENAIGWYHSHPGFGCWLSGIDVATQMLNQNFQDPWAAIVIDPIRTISAGKVNIGAFRTYPKGYKPPDEEPNEYQTIPLHKIEDFGVQCNKYYSMDISYFKSAMDKNLLDSLWNHYWVNTLSSSTLLTNSEYTTGQISDLADKLETWDNTFGRAGYVMGHEGTEKKADDKLSKATTDSCKITTEVLNGMLGQIIKDRLFNQVTSGGSGCKPPPAIDPPKPAA